MRKHDFGIDFDFDDHCGFCPRCGENGDYSAEYECRNFLFSNFFCCEKHNCYWKVDWKWNLDPQAEDSEEYWNKSDAVLATMTEVEPRHLPETERNRRRAERQS